MNPPKPASSDSVTVVCSIGSSGLSFAKSSSGMLNLERSILEDPPGFEIGQLKGF